MSQEAPQEAKTGLDPWLGAGAPLLALVAGYVNVLLLMSFAIPVSHVTGALAHLALDGVRQEFPHLRMAASMTLLFLFGAALSGYWIGGQMFQHRRRYGAVFIVQGLAFVLSAYLLRQHQWLAVPAAAFGCGMQNALASSYRGLNLRTTHMTGVVTDLGVLLGLRARGQQVSGWRLLLLGLLFGGYLAGTFLGVLAGSVSTAAGLYAAGLACIIGGGLYLLAFRRLTKRPR